MEQEEEGETRYKKFVGTAVSGAVFRGLNARAEQNFSITAFLMQALRGRPFFFFYLMTDWLPIRKHFITPRYSRQVNQSSQDSGCLAHMDVRDLIALKAKGPVPGVPAIQRCLLSFVRARIIYMSKPGVVTGRQMRPADDARVQRLSQYSDEVYWMLTQTMERIFYHQMKRGCCKDPSLRSK